MSDYILTRRASRIVGLIHNFGISALQEPDWPDGTCEALEAARKKHSVFARSYGEAVAVLLEEAGEIARAELEGNREQAELEWRDFVVVLLRWDREGITRQGGKGEG